MLSEADWLGLGVAATLVIALIAYRQFRVSRDALRLDVVKSTPKIGTAIRINKRQENPPGFPPFYYLIATITNDGELPAKQLKGYCKLFSPANVTQEHTIPVGVEFLSSPFELEPYRLNGIFLDPNRPESLRLNVDIEFSYLGLEDSPAQKYSEKYEYDPQHEYFKRRSANDSRI